MRRPVRNSAGLDISNALAGWNFQPGEVNVRLIRGHDGRQKIQMRLDLGLLQMETSGRPDGRRPHNCLSELQYQISRRRAFTKRNGSAEKFTISSADIRALREESAMYYHRYLAFFVLGNYEGVVRDTQHNLTTLDFCQSVAHTSQERHALERYRPHVVMMQGRARACMALKKGLISSALAYLQGSLRLIEQCTAGDARSNADAHHSGEARIILEMIQDIKRQLPTDPRQELQQLLSKAVERENFEEAAALRDQIMAMQTMSGIERPGEPTRAPRRQRSHSDSASQTQSPADSQARQPRDNPEDHA